MCELDFDYCVEELDEYNTQWDNGTYENEHPDWMLCVSTGKRGHGICSGSETFKFYYSVSINEQNKTKFIIPLKKL